MIERNSALPDYFLLLQRKESFAEYARAYGDAIADHYERNGVIIIPHLPLALDLDYLQNLVPLMEWRKMGTMNGIERSIIGRSKGGFVIREDHPLLAMFGSLNEALYFQRQVTAFNAGLRHGLAVLFPRYLSLQEANITWRLFETVEEGLHLDAFAKGAPLPPQARSLHRLKLFINIDAEPRRWRTSYDLAGVLRAARGVLPDELPNDLNVVNDLIDRFRALDDLPCHRIAYPTLSAVLANGETVAHEVVYGRRVVAGEFFCQRSDMLSPARHSHACLERWLRDAGYGIAADAGAVSAKHAHLPTSYERRMAARAST
jgi:hypothetical protein